MNTMEIEFFTNCAVLLKYGTDLLLVDGIFSDKQPFNVMDKDIEEAIIYGTGKYGERYRNIKYVLVTHCHNDHYNGTKMISFLKNHPETVVLVPANARLDGTVLEAARAKVLFLDSGEGKLKSVSFGPFTIEYMRIKHLTYKYPNHFCYNVITPNENVLTTADMDLNKIPMLEEFTKKNKSCVFVNNICLWHKRWRDSIKNLGYEKVVYYHMPHEDRDVYGYRWRAESYWQKFNGEIENSEMLDIDNCNITL